MKIKYPMELAKELFSLPTNGATINSAEEITGQGADYVKVLGGIHPVDPAAPDIQFQVNLPTNWNGKLLHLGGGRFDGFLVNGEGLIIGQGPEDISPLAAGYATCGSDSGHTADFASGNPWDSRFALNEEALRNFAHEHIKKTIDAANWIVRQFYGVAPKKQYFAGGSNGGRTALNAAIRYPEVYDGILCLFPVLNWVEKAIKDAANATFLAAQNWEGILEASQYREVTEKIIAICGDEKGLIRNLADAQTHEQEVKAALRSMLTEDQMHAMEQFASPLEFPYPLFGDVRSMPGYSVFQGEPLADSFSTQYSGSGKRDGAMAQFGDAVIRYQIMRDERFDPTALDMNVHREKIQQASALLDATDADLRPFVSHGGKLLLLHGLMDQVVTPLGTIDYYDRAKKIIGPAADTHLRFYQIPNYGHGIGEHFVMQADLLGVLDRWVTEDCLPNEIPAKNMRPGAERETLTLLPC